MPTDLPLDQHIRIIFDPFKRRGTGDVFPKPGSLAMELQKVVEKAVKENAETVRVIPQTTSLFATAAVEMWMRGVHSFLISAALTQVSPVWSSISGYYASHYVVRGFAHLLGFFLLYRKKRIIQIEIVKGGHVCRIIKKNAGDREHKFYWKTVKQHAQFKNDPFFTINPDDNDVSDSEHRNKASYLDHIGQFPNFNPLVEKYLKERLHYLAAMELSSVPVPNRKRFPDVVAVQLIALHRIVKFRELIDNVLGGKNRFWTAHRNPGWCAGFIDFNVVPPRFLEAYGSQA